MRLKLILIGIVVIAIALFFASSKVSFAQQWCGGCQVNCYQEWDPVNFVYYERCVDGCNGCANTGCQSGFYECNRTGGCCPVGSGTPGGGGGGGGPDPIYGGNCPSGTVVDYNQPIATVCSSQEQGYQMGNAQQITGCCREVTRKGECTVRCEQRRRGEVCWKDCAEDEVNCAQNYYTTYACVPICNTTAPVITGITKLSPTKATINWTAGTGGSKQKIFIGANKSLVESNCVGNQSPACVVNKQNLTASQTSYTTGNVLSFGTVYYVRVINSGGSSCNSNSQTAKFLSSCLLSPSAVTKNINQTQDLISNLSSSTEITKVKYTSNSTGVASVSPANDTSYVYKTTATAKSVGNATVTSDVYFGSVITCTANSTVSVIDPKPWWQIKDGDVTTNGDISSKVPSGQFFNLNGLGGFPGVPVYGGALGVYQGTISSKNWNANTTTSLPRIFDYSYFENLIPDDTVINDISKLTTGVGVTTDANGYEWYKITGNLDTVGNIDFGSRKVILFVKTGLPAQAGNLNINGKINLTDNQGFFGAFVNGNINVAASVTGSPSLEGMYVADSGFSTGLGTSQLHVRGSVASFGGITMQRDLTDDSVTPAEFFEFAPDQVMLFPQKLMYRRTKWAEVAP